MSNRSGLISAVGSAAAVVALSTTAIAQLPTPKPPDTVFLEELTWDELALHIRSGKTTAIIGTAGTEQKGPHLPIGEHRYTTEYCADKIARALGNAIVSPVITYVPAGDFNQASGHMRMAGTVTLPEDRFRMLLELQARSLKGSGFKEIILIGDSGGNQDGMQFVANKLNADSTFVAAGVRVHFIGDYYRAAHAAQQAWLVDTLKVVTREELGSHANIMDTSELMYIHPQLVRTDRYNLATAANGVSGDPRKASPEIGKYLLDIKIKLGLAQIRQSLATPRAGGGVNR
jgi:creatinine amidohydrolase/Fe(II)-dependent formamide hydrolase-like protein